MEPDRESPVEPEGPPAEPEVDATIVATVLDGNVDAFGELVERHQARVRGMMRRMCGNDYEAEELSQEVFVRTFFALPTFKPKYAFGAWISRIAYNAAINYLRKERRVTQASDVGRDEDDPAVLDPVDPGPSPEQTVEGRERAEKVLSAAKALPSGFRDIFVLRHLGELSYQEIADVTGLPMGTVKSRLARARGIIVRSASADS